MHSSMFATARFCAASQTRRSLRTLLALTLLVGFVGAVVLTAAAGARRTDSAFDRMKVETHAAVLRIFGQNVDDATVVKLGALPEVEGVGLARQLVSQVDGDFTSFGGPLDDKVGRTVERPRLLEGRRPHSGAVREIAIPETLAALHHLRIGDSFTIRAYSPADVQQLMNSGQGDPTGPRFRMRVVGITRAPGDLSIEGRGGGLTFSTRAFERRHGEEFGTFAPKVLLIRVAPGADPAPVVRRARELLAPKSSPGEFQVQPTSEIEGGIQESIGVATTGLVVFAIVAGLAGLVVLAITVRRTAEGFGGDLPVLRALGVARSSRVLSVALSFAPVALGGAVLALVGAVLASPIMPLGLARDAEPDLGLAFDAAALLGGLVAMLAVVTLLASWSAYRVDALAAKGDTATPGSSRFARRAIAAGFSPPVTVGLAMTLEPGRGSRAIPVRMAVGAAVVAVLGLVGVLVVGTSLDDLTRAPRAFGFNWDATTSVGRLPRHRAAGPCSGLRTTLVDDPAIAGATEVCSTSSEIDGHPATVFGFAPLRGDVQPTVLEGRAPRSARETALATDTFDAIGVEIGDTVRIAGSDATRRFRVVGRVVLPLFKGTSDLQAVADGATLTGAALASIAHDDSTTPVVALRWKPGADVGAARARIGARPRQIVPLLGPKVPLEVDRLQQADALPWVLGAFLAVVGTLGLAYALITGVRRRGRDFATLKTLGFRRRQIASTVAVQASLVAGAGVLIGMPIGIVVGRLVWDRIADGAGMLGIVAVPVLGLVVVAIATVLVANLVAAVPARRAARLRPAVVLRSE